MSFLALELLLYEWSSTSIYAHVELRNASCAMWMAAGRWAYEYLMTKTWISRVEQLP